MTTFDEHSRDEVFRDYLNEARAAKDYAASGMDALPETADRLVGRGQIHATLAHAAATLLAAMPEQRAGGNIMISPSVLPEHQVALDRAERDALRDRVDELVAQGLTMEDTIADGARSRAKAHEPGTAPLCTCGHHSDQHLAVTLPEGDVVLLCELCDCKRYTPNTSEVDGWSEPDARGARFRVARFEQNGHVPPVYFKVTDQLGIVPPREFKYEDSAQAVAEDLNRMTSTSTDASVETKADPWKAPIKGNVEVRPAVPQPESPATALVTAARNAMKHSGLDASEWAARAAAIAVLRALAEMNDDVFGNRATSRPFTSLADELEQHTDTPTTE